MSTITTIASSDLITNSRTDINTNFSNLNTDKMETSVLDTDTTLAANSDAKVATQKATKAYVDAGGNVNASTTNKGIVEEATQAEVDAGTDTGATGAKLFIGASKMTTKFSTATVFNTTPPTTYTDLDMSATIGTKSRVVILRITQTNSGNADRDFEFRKNGETETIGATVNMNKITGLNVAGSIRGLAYVMCVTDSSGVIEWLCSSTASSTVVTLKLESYW